jgi:tetratricopeptide (TPR) repeat protein
LAQLHRESQRWDEAIQVWNDLAALSPETAASAYLSIATILRTQGKLVEALSEFKLALKAKPDWPLPMTGIAQILAVHYDPKVRDANEAVALAERAAERTKYENATIVDTLATRGRNFERAVEPIKAPVGLEKR